MEPTPRIFLSHASADREVANLVRDVLTRGGVPADSIFYSSDRANGIPSGTEVVTHLRRVLKSSDLVIELMSQAFLASPMCLMELGGAWILEKSTFPVVLPPLSSKEVTDKIGNFQMNVLGTDSEVDEAFAELQDRIRSDLGLNISSSRWTQGTAGLKRHLAVVRVGEQRAAIPQFDLPPSASYASTQRVGAVWPEHLLRRLAGDRTKSVVILRVLLDVMAAHPERSFHPQELSPFAEQAGYSSSSMSNALGKLASYFGGPEYRRKDYPFMHDGAPGKFSYRMSAEQAKAWLAVRTGR